MVSRVRSEPMRRLAIRTILGFAQVVVALGVGLFGPAWTFDFWQAWVYILVFTASAALITLYLWNRDPRLLQRRLNAGPTAEHEQSQRLIQLVAALAFISLFVVSSLDRRFSWSNVPTPIVIAADIVVVVGF